MTLEADRIEGLERALQCCVDSLVALGPFPEWSHPAVSIRMARVLLDKQDSGTREGRDD